MIRALIRFGRLPSGERLYLGEAMAALLVAAVCVGIIPFRTLARFAARPPRSTKTAASPATEVRTVRSAIQTCARRSPLRAKCFEQALAAVWLLRRRGLVPTLHYGVAKRGGQLVAHVWVTAGGRDVIGCENATEFNELARFSPP